MPTSADRKPDTGLWPQNGNAFAGGVPGQETRNWAPFHEEGRVSMHAVLETHLMKLSRVDTGRWTVVSGPLLLLLYRRAMLRFVEFAFRMVCVSVILMLLEMETECSGRLARRLVVLEAGGCWIRVRACRAPASSGSGLGEKVVERAVGRRASGRCHHCPWPVAPHFQARTSHRWTMSWSRV